MKIITKGAVAMIAVLLLIQLVPYGKDHKNPIVVKEPVWSSQEVRSLAKKACFNCHSHETVWPSYSKIAPISWLVSFDVADGRKHLNFSDWQGGKREGEDPIAIAKEISKGEMPPFAYVIAHPEAKLTTDEKKNLSDGLKATIAQSTN